MSPGTSTPTGTTNVSPSIFDFAIDRYGFDYPVWADNYGADVDVHFDDDEEEKEDKENTPPSGDHDDDDNQLQRLRRSNGVPFQKGENITDFVFKSLFQYCF